jgi:hypothetical protein
VTVKVNPHVDLSILEDLDFEPPCEQSGHGRGLYYGLTGRLCVGHADWADTAEWVVDSYCSACDAATSMLVCDAYVEQLKSMNEGDHPLICEFCGDRRPVSEWLFTLTRIKETT